MEKLNRDGGAGASRQKTSKEDVTVADLRKVEELEKKVTTEHEALKEKKKKMDEEFEMFADLEGLKRRAEARKQQLVVEKQNLSRYRENIKYELKQLQFQYETVQAQLFDNDTHNQVNFLNSNLSNTSSAPFSSISRYCVHSNMMRI